MSIDTFWSSSIDEITDMLESYNRREIIRNKELIAINEFLANRIVEILSSAFDKNAKVKPIYEYYPELFEGEKRIVEEQKAKAEREMFKERFRAFANKHNSTI